MLSMFDAVCRHENSDAVAIRYEKKIIRFPELISNIRRMIVYLQKLGIRPGDTVTVSLPNLPVAVYALYALDAVGAVQNIIHPLAPIEQILRTAKETDSKLVLVLSTRLKESRGEMEQSGYRFAFVNPMYDVSFPMRVLCDLKFGRPGKSETLLNFESFRSEKPTGVPVQRDTSAPCIYLHSGGTTADPKIIELSDDAMNHLASKADGIMLNGIAGKGVLAVLPAFHGFGLGMGIHSPLYWGTTSVLMTKFDAEKSVRLIDRGLVNVLLGVPLLYQKLMQVPSFDSADLTHLECAFIGGDRVPQSLIERFNNVLQEKGSDGKMLEGYGLTETVTVCTVNTTKDFRICSVGKPLRDLRVTVRDEQEKELPAGTVGEVYIAGDTLMNGYYRDTEADAQTLRELDGTVWVRSGDLGYLDEDGFLFLKGRKKRVYKIAGINVYPTEVEKLATEMQADVFDAALILFSEEQNPYTVLYLIRSRHSTRTEQEIRERLMAEMEQKLLKYSRPRRIEFVTEFPKTRIGKVDYRPELYPNQKN